VRDNRGLPGAGVLQDAYVDVLPGMDSAETEWTVSHQPGDNYRMAASTAPAWLASLDALQPSTTGEMSYAGPEVSPMLTVWRTLHIEADSMAPPPTEDTPPDAPEYAERNFIKGRVLRIGVEGPTLALDTQGSGPSALPTPTAYEPRYAYLEPEATEPALALRDGSRDLAQGHGGRFEHGRMQVGGPADPCWVTELDGNGVDAITGWEYVRSIATPPDVSRLRLPFVARGAGLDDVSGFVMGWDAAARRATLDSALPGAYIGGTLAACGLSWTIAGVSGEDLTVADDAPLTFVLWDDDATPWPFTTTSKYLRHSDNPAENLLAQAYVRPAWTLEDRRQARFVRHLWRRLPWTPESETLARTQLAAGREQSSLPGYWSVYLQGAFQSAATNDADPDAEGSDLGYTLGLSDTYGSLVALESSNDKQFCPREDALDHTVAHEVGHQLGLDHTSDDVMAVSLPPACQPVRDFLSASSLATIRRKGTMP
jgi:hypothetical protein